MDINAAYREVGSYRLVAQAKATGRSNHNRGQRPGVWAPGAMLVIDWGLPWWPWMSRTCVGCCPLIERCAGGSSAQSSAEPQVTPHKHASVAQMDRAAAF
jgi:hypothetical protein